MIPNELLENRETIELNFIASLYKDISLCDDYKNIINGTDIITDSGKIYYGIISNMYKLGYESADEVSVKNYLDSKPSIKKQYKQFGELKQSVNIDNIEAYYDELIKSNFLIKLHSEGFNVLENLKEFANMSCEEVYDYYEYKLSDINLTSIQKSEIEDLSDSEGYNEWLKEVINKKNIGFRMGSQFIDYTTSGVHRGELMLVIAGGGKGKSSSSVPLFILPAIEDGETITIICNEQNSKQWRNMIISTVLFSKIIDDTGLTRAKIMKGSYNDEQMQKVEEAIAWIGAQKGRIRFKAMDNYDIVNVKKVIRKMSKQGCKYFFYDVLKPVKDSSDKAWAELADNAKELYCIAKKENVAIIASAQLATDSLHNKFLDQTSVGKSKAICECAAVGIAFRHLTDNEKKYIKPFIVENGQKKLITLNDSSKYIIVFFLKNRFGDADNQIILEFNQSQNTIKDIGFYKMSYDDELKKI